MKTWIGVLLSAVLALPAWAQEKQTLVIKSEVEDNMAGMVLADGGVISLVIPREEWGINLPHHLLDTKRFTELEILFCEPFTMQVASPPLWAMSEETAGPHAFAGNFLKSAPMPFEFIERVAYITDFLEREKHPDIENMKQKLISWAATLAKIEVPCSRSVKLTAPVPAAQSVHFALRGKWPNYRLVSTP